MTVDILKPVYYYIEGRVASKSIPNASNVPNRLRLKDVPLDASKKLKFNHSKWNKVLQRHLKVKQGTIGDVTEISMLDYQAVSEDPDYIDYIAKLAKANPAKLQKAEQLAFWMNAYNALCVNIIIQHEKKTGSKIASITNLTSDGNPVWDQVAGQVNGKDISLNTIEHEKLRKVWAEPAVHACIVCASASCPNLRNKAFTATNLKAQMDDQMRDWMTNKSKGITIMDGNKIVLSRIFLWFASDFGGVKGIRSWLPKYLDNKDLAKRLASGAPIRYFEYGWQINRAAPSEMAPRKTTSSKSKKMKSPKKMKEAVPAADDNDDNKEYSL